MDVLWDALRLGAGCWFVWSGSRRLREPARFRDRVAEQGIVGPRGARRVAATVPVTELVAGLLFAAGCWTAVLAAALGGLVVASSAATVAVLARGGRAARARAAPGWQRGDLATLGRNGAIGVALVLGSLSRPGPQVGEWVVAILAVALCCAVAIGTFRAMDSEPSHP